MKNMKTVQVLRDLLKHLEYYNKMAPFPVYDTEYVEEVKQYLKHMEKTDNNYDDEPVDACKNCKNLYIVIDEDENSICMKCNSINEIKTYANIAEYLKVKTIWNE